MDKTVSYADLIEQFTNRSLMEKVQHGEYITVREFLELPEGWNVELFDGQLVYKYGNDYTQAMAAPSGWHQSYVVEICYRIKDYIRNHGGKCRVFSAPYDVRLDKNRDKMVQPDITVVCDPKKTDHNRFCDGVPDWIIEIVSRGNASHDKVRKYNAYRDAGVREYWMVIPQENRIVVCRFEKGIEETYDLHETVRAGIYEDLSIDFAEISDEIGEFDMTEDY